MKTAENSSGMEIPPIQLDLYRLVCAIFDAASKANHKAKTNEEPERNEEKWNRKN